MFKYADGAAEMKSERERKGSEREGDVESAAGGSLNREMRREPLRGRRRTRAAGSSPERKEQMRRRDAKAREGRRGALQV